jgi:hypothetical protein
LDLKVLAFKAIQDLADDRDRLDQLLQDRIQLGYAAGITRSDIARALGRTEGAIRDREKRAGK